MQKSFKRIIRDCLLFVVFGVVLSVVSISFIYAKDKINTKEDILNKREELDKIVARVNGINILKSDLDQRVISKNGEPFTLEELISEQLFIQKAAERNLWPSELEVEKQIVSLKIHNGISDLTPKQFEEELSKEGFTINEYKDQLARMLASEKLKHAEFSERVVVTSQEVEDYHKKNPEKISEKYLIKMCDLDEKDLDEKGELVKKGDFKLEEIGWIEKKDLNSNISFVSKMKKGEISKPVKIGSLRQLVKLEDKKGERIKTLEERYSQIENTLHAKKKEKFEKEFEKELREKASIVYLT
ncbi:SurA N-terminal domain-containing protein [Candidatus Babeliales bacterium]|nr:SurA N-terminal domain-containing protein [Candidatus Babeliales bacterium]